MMTYIVGVVGILLNLAIYQQNTSKRVLLVKLISNVVWAMYYAFEGAYMGVCVACIGIARETTFILVKRKEKLGVMCLGLFACVSVICSILTWKTVFSILPAIGSIVSVFGFYFAIPKLSRCLAIPIALCMGFYDISAGAWVGLANEIITIASAVIGIIYIDILKKESIQDDRHSM